MHGRRCFVLLLCMLACGGCSKEKSTAQLLEDLKGPLERDRLIAVRLLPQRQEDAVLIIPALIDALKDEGDDIRMAAAWGLGTFGEQATDAIPALEQAKQTDRDARARKAAGLALSRIDPTRFPAPSKAN